MDSSQYEEFMEGINHFATGTNEVYVTFTVHAANYRLPIEHPDFVEQVANLAAAWKRNQPAKIVVEGLEIVSVAAA